MRDMYWSKIANVTMYLYSAILLALIASVCVVPNHVTVYTEINVRSETRNVTAQETIQATHRDATWTVLTATIIGITLITIFTTYLSIRTKLGRISNWDAPEFIRKRFVFIVLFWLLASLSVAIIGFSVYKPVQGPLVVAQQQFTPKSNNCTLYYTPSGMEKYAHGPCYILMPGLNVTHNQICCVNVNRIYYLINLSIPSLVGIIAIVFTPVWMLAYSIMSFKNHNYTPLL